VRDYLKSLRDAVLSFFSELIIDEKFFKGQSSRFGSEFLRYDKRNSSEEKFILKLLIL
jgi:hypothetical protein